jgi:hypothetical protein
VNYAIDTNVISVRKGALAIPVWPPGYYADPSTEPSSEHGRSGAQPLSSLSLALCHPNSEATRLVVIDEMDSGLFERRLNFQES